MLTLIEARPGAGKTTALRRLAEQLRERGATLAGLVTDEIREGGTRAGFQVETLGGERGTLAHQNFSGPPRVGRYGVAIGDFERLALPALRLPADVILIDELGRMELASPRSGTPWRTWSKGTRPSWRACTLVAIR
jgi:nucleoside-triphosphatase